MGRRYGIIMLAAGLLSSCSQTTVVQTTTTVPQAEKKKPVSIDWERVQAPADCMCSDGSEFWLQVRNANPKKVMLYFEGGGACFDASSCDPASERYATRIDTTDPALGASRSGIFDVTNPMNPVADYSMVYVPYCTGDVHLGNATTVYGPGLTIQHKGSVNAKAGLAELIRRFPEVEDLVVAGVSAGSIPSPMYAALAADQLPQAKITVVADGSGAYPDVPLINKVIGTQWGTMNAVPDWPETRSLTAEQWSIPGLFTYAHRHSPAITYARHDFAFDETQQTFAALAGIDASKMDQLMNQNEAQIERDGFELLTFLSPGDRHTILGRPEVYTHEVSGAKFIDWLTAIIEHRTTSDVKCVKCTG